LIQLGLATIADLPLLQYWDEQPHVIESDPNLVYRMEIETFSAALGVFTKRYRVRLRLVKTPSAVAN